MKKFFLFFLFISFVVGLLTVNSLRAEEGIIAQDKDQELSWSERDVGKLARAYVRPGLGKGSVVEYFGDAHRQSLLNQAKEAGFTVTEAQSLLDKALSERKTLRGRGPQALNNFYTALDAKRALAGTGASLASIKAEILAEVDRKIAQAKKSGLEEGNKAIEVLRAEMATKLTQAGGVPTSVGTAIQQVQTASVSPTSTGVKTVEERLGVVEARLDNPTTGLEALNNRVDNMDRAWEQIIQETHQAIRQIDRKVKVVNAKVDNLAVAETYLHSTDKKQRQKGLGLLYLARNGQFRTKNKKDAEKYSTGLQLPNQVENVDIQKEVLPVNCK